MKIREWNEMMAYLTRPAPKKVAGLMEEYYGSDRLKYQEAVKNGFQGTFEEYLQWMRKNAAQGGVIGKGGMFQGEDLGYRTGFKKIKLSTQRGTEYIDTAIQKAYENYLKTELKNGDMSKTLKFGSNSFIDLVSYLGVPSFLYPVGLNTSGPFNFIFFGALLADIPL